MRTNQLRMIAERPILVGNLLAATETFYDLQMAQVGMAQLNLNEEQMPPAPPPVLIEEVLDEEADPDPDQDPLASTGWTPVESEWSASSASASTAAPASSATESAPPSTASASTLTPS